MKFCEKCHKEVKYKIVNEEVNYNINNQSISIKCDVPRCNECGEELNDNDLFEKNSKLARDKYIENYNIITVDEIKSLLNILGVSATELSEQLGWDKMTIARYLSGKLPAVEHSNKLKEL